MTKIMIEATFYAVLFWGIVIVPTYVSTVPAITMFELPKVGGITLLMGVLLALGGGRFALDRTYRESALRVIFVQNRWLALLLALMLLPLGPVWFSELREVHIWGNEFRHQGLFFYVLLICSTFLTALWLARPLVAASRWAERYKLLVLFWLGGLVQTIWASVQIFSLSAEGRFLLEVKGDEAIYGSFGQGNFWSGTVLVGIFSALAMAAFLLKQPATKQTNRQKLVRAATASSLALSILLMSFTLFWSGSTWAQVLFVFSFIQFAAWPFGTRLWRGWLAASRAALWIALPALVVGGWLTQRLVDHRGFIWTTVLESFLHQPSITKFVWGQGLDTMAQVLISLDIHRGGYIDRAHNLSLDVLFSFGIIGLFAFSLFLWKYYRIFLHEQTRRDFSLALFALASEILLLKAIVHEMSVVNLWQMWLVVAYTCLILAKSNSNNHTALLAPRNA